MGEAGVVFADGGRVCPGRGQYGVVWDAVSGECVLGPLEGHTSPGEFGVVSDSRRVVSGRDGRCVWDAVGECVLGRGGTLRCFRCRFLLTAGVWCQVVDNTARVGCRIRGVSVGAAEGTQIRCFRFRFLLTAGGVRVVGQYGACRMPCQGECVLGPLGGCVCGGSVSFLLTAGVWCQGRGRDGARVGCRVGGMRVGAAGGAHAGEFGVVFC